MTLAEFKNIFIVPLLKKTGNLFLYLLGGFLLLILVELFGFSQNPANEKSDFNQYYKVFQVPLPDTIRFSGEPVPMNVLGIRENIDQEILVNAYWQSQIMLMMKRSNRYFPRIVKILNKDSVPEDFKYLALAESGFSYKVSSAGAAGFWQLMKNTAEAYGLFINKDVDERYNLEKSTDAACQFFKESYHHLHNWTLVAASYNMGLAGIEREIKMQGESSYYNLGLNSETSRYIYRVLALKEIMQYPHKYGFYLKNSDLYPSLPLNNYTLDSSVSDLADFAKSLHSNYRILKIFNPWLLSNRLSAPGEGLSYIITLPKNNICFNDLGENITIGDSVENISHAPDSTEVKNKTSGENTVIHIVKPGETLQSIAKEYKVSVERIESWNSINDTMTINPGFEIMIFIDK